MGIMNKEELVLEGLFPPLSAYPLKGEMLMGVSCIILRLSLKKGDILDIYNGKARGNPRRHEPIYMEMEVLKMGNTIFQGRVKYHRYSVSYSRSVVWKVHDIIQAADDIYQ